MDKGGETKRKQHPKDCASFFSLATFAYIFKLIHKGRRKEIDENDLSEVMSTLRSKQLGDDLEQCWMRNSKQSIIRALITCHGFFLFILWIGHLSVNVIFIYTMPWAVGKFVSYFETGQTAISKNEALLYAMVIISFNTLNGFWRQHYELWKIELVLKMQTSLSSLLYRKALTLSHIELNNISTGTVVTGITKDVLTINYAIIFGLDNLADVVQIVLVSYLLYQKVGMAAIGGIGIIFFCLFSQFSFAVFTYRRRGACNEKTGERLKQTNEVLSSIRLIKMYAWESFFEKRLLWLRKIELKNLYMVFILKTVARVIGSIAEKTAQILTLLLYSWLGGMLNADIVYYTGKLFLRVAKIMIIIPLGIQSLSEFMISLKRINKILRTEDRQIVYKDVSQTLKPQISLTEVDVEIKGREILKNINLELKIGLNILIGPSGSGKSSLLKTILEEYSTKTGEMRARGTLSYASQNPWLFPSSLKQNILFGEPLNEYKYRNILEMCGLTYDISSFAIGDEVTLTDCGANLSRGQQARINLARALYRESDIYLLDDSLASLDIHIKNHVFNNAIKSNLRNKLCLLVTHSTQYINQADNIIIMEAGRIKYTGKPTDIPPELLTQTKYNKNTILNEFSELNNEDENKKDDDVFKEDDPLLSNRESTKTSNIYKENKEGGKVDFEVYKSYVKHGGGLVMLFSVCSIHIISEASSGLGEKFLSKW
ncbi:hypothetical protein HHI36_005344 [Cryptolaemus montrouzieri]|uniref:Uncharacterized protein n=1 Tax=Cryptolaemus montrouzieri TaxID=559131 RepID=A0ABD2NU81_9CUCU